MCNMFLSINHPTSKVPKDNNLPKQNILLYSRNPFLIFFKILLYMNINITSQTITHLRLEYYYIEQNEKLLQYYYLINIPHYISAM